MLTTLVMMLAVIGMVVGLFLGHLAHGETNQEWRRSQRLKIIVIGCDVAVTCWLLVWWLAGMSAVLWPYCFVGFIPMTIVYSHEFVADGFRGWDFETWFWYGVVASIPVVGPIMVVVFGLISLINSSNQKRHGTPQIEMGETSASE